MVFILCSAISSDATLFWSGLYVPPQTVPSAIPLWPHDCFDVSISLMYVHVKIFIFISFWKWSLLVHACMCAKLLQSCPTFCDPMYCSPPGSSVLGRLQAKIQQWVACPPPGDAPDPGIKPEFLMSSALAGRIFTASASWEARSLPVENGKRKSINKTKSHQ